MFAFFSDYEFIFEKESKGISELIIMSWFECEQRKVGKLEQRLAAARAAMRKVASESEGERSNLSVATTARDDSYHRYGPAGAIYRNARLFYR